MQRSASFLGCELVVPGNAPPGAVGRVATTGPMRTLGRRAREAGGAASHVSSGTAGASQPASQPKASEGRGEGP